MAVAAAPRIDPRLIRAIERLDDPARPVAELWRRIGAEADRLGLTRPSYEQVRLRATPRGALATAPRRIGPSLLDVYLDVATQARPPIALLEHLAGL